MDNTLILVDYDNVFVTLKNNYRNFRNPNIMYDVISKIKENYADDNILSYRLFADFQKVNISDEGYNILKKNHVEVEHVFNGKNASDVILMINCMKYMMQYPHINKIVLVSSDSDLVPIFHEVQLLNKKLEVLYFDINTGKDHIEHIKEIGIKSNTLEVLMGLSVYQDCKEIEEFFTYKTADKKYFQELLQHINTAIADMYGKHLKKNSDGKVISAGAVLPANISYYLKDKGICPDKEFWTNSTDSYKNLLSLLMDKHILVKYVYHTGGRDFTTFILSEEYLTKNGYVIDGLVKQSDYPAE